MRTSGRASEVEEQTDGCGIGSLLQGNALALQHERCATSNIVALLDEEVGIASIGKLEGYARQILIGLHHHIEVIGLRS